MHRAAWGRRQLASLVPGRVAPRPPVYDSDFKSAIAPGIYISTATDAGANLALEEWMSGQLAAAGQPALLLWRNQPCVIIGRTQNPWIECDLRYLQRNNIALLRRRSGGGAVYHDVGNMNCTFFASRSGHDPQRNAHLLARAIRQSTGVVAQTTKRSDLFVAGKKISGSAFRLVRLGP